MNSTLYANWQNEVECGLDISAHQIPIDQVAITIYLEISSFDRVERTSSHRKFSFNALESKFNYEMTSHWDQSGKLPLLNDIQ